MSAEPLKGWATLEGRKFLVFSQPSTLQLLSGVVRSNHPGVRVARSRHTVIEQREVLITDELFFPVDTDEHHRVTFASARLILVAHRRCGHRPVI